MDRPAWDPVRSREILAPGMVRPVLLSITVTFIRGSGHCTWSRLSMRLAGQEQQVSTAVSRPSRADFRIFEIYLFSIFSIFFFLLWDYYNL